MMSDSLVHAVAEIEKWQREKPEWYGGHFIKKEIETVKASLRTLQRKVDRDRPEDRCPHCGLRHRT